LKNLFLKITLEQMLGPTFLKLWNLKDYGKYFYVLENIFKFIQNFGWRK